MIDLLAAPFAACLILTGVHCYLGIHVVTRGVIFVDLALAQLAALGGVTAILIGHGCSHDDSMSYFLALGFALFGALLFALGRFREERVPQEAVIGIVYAVAGALTIMALDRAPHGLEALQSLLVGSVLFVTWTEVLKIAVIYSIVGVLQFFFRERFILISSDVEKARRQGVNVRLWDFIFYALFGVVITSSVRIAGVLLVFSYLVVPAACAILFAKSIMARLLIGWAIGFLVSVLGLALSVKADLPTGASVVAVFGCAMLASAVISGLNNRRTGRREP